MATKKPGTLVTPVAAEKKALLRARAQPSYTKSHLVHILLWVAIIVGLVWFLHAVSPILLPFVMGGIMAYLFDPLADRMEARGISRVVATSVITLGFFSLLVALLVWLGPLLYTQLSQLIAKVPLLIRDAEALLREQGQPLFNAMRKFSNGEANDMPGNAGEVVQRAFALGGQMLLTVLASGGALLNVLSLLLITPLVSFYLLLDWDKGVARVNQLLPLAYAPTIRRLAREINATLAGYLRGQLYVMLILAVFYVSLLSILGLKFSLIIGVLAGFMVIVPYLGTLVSTTLGLIVAYGQYELTTPFWVVALVFGLGQVLESQILTPKVIGNRVGLHPLWLLFGMLAGGVLLGFVGVLLAVPITAVISVLVKFALSIYLESSLYKDK